jgi:hypothetical protein
MRSDQRFSPWAKALSLLTVLVMGSLLVADAPDSTIKPSSYAPAKDLIGPLEGYVKSLEEDLSDADNYGRDQKNRVAKDAGTVAVLALVLGKHDEPHPLKAAAPALVAAAGRLSEHAENYDQAVPDLAALKQALASQDGGELSWKPVADIRQLMRQVPVVNNNLRRGVTGRRFDRTLDQSAGYAATLAAIAQASRYDTNYCQDEAGAKKWAQICDEMRDAAAAVHQAVRKSDQDMARKGLDRLVATCDACHAEFR